jgi:hypothetical protein
MLIDLRIAQKVLTAVDAGLVKGIGVQKPGQMCVEAAVCYALGLPHGDDPKCVSPVLRSLKIRLNDSNWSSDKARAAGLRRLALVQLGSVGVLDESEFAKRCARLVIQTSLVTALRAAAKRCKDEKKRTALTGAADACERDPSRDSALRAQNAAYAAYAAYAADAADAAAYAAAAYAYADATTRAADAAYAAYAADAAADAAYTAAYTAAATARDAVLSAFAEGVVQILIEMKVPGVQWLHLTGVKPYFGRLS